MAVNAGRAKTRDKSQPI